MASAHRDHPLPGGRRSAIVAPASRSSPPVRGEQASATRRSCLASTQASGNSFATARAWSCRSPRSRSMKSCDRPWSTSRYACANTSRKPTHSPRAPPGRHRRRPRPEPAACKAGSGVLRAPPAQGIMRVNVDDARGGRSATSSRCNVGAAPERGVPLMRREGPLFEYACHEGNHDIRHISRWRGTSSDRRPSRRRTGGRRRTAPGRLGAPAAGLSASAGRETAPPKFRVRRQSSRRGPACPAGERGTATASRRTTGCPSR